MIYIVNAYLIKIVISTYMVYKFRYRSILDKHFEAAT